MADQMINELPVKTAPQTGDKFLVVGPAEEQLIDYDKLADAILGKIASKTFALDQGTKSLVAALNELNSKTKKKIVTCVLPEGFERLAGHSYVVNNILYINEAIQFPNTILKGDDIVSDIKVDGKSINANWAYGLISKKGLDPCHCLLEGNKIKYESGDIPTGYVIVTVVASLK